MLVDDDHLALKATTRRLAQAGHSVLPARTFEHAAHLLRHAYAAGSAYQAIVTDHDLVGTNSGAKSSAFLRQWLREPAVVVVYTGNPDAARADAPENTSVVSKPNLDTVIELLQKSAVSLREPNLHARSARAVAEHRHQIDCYAVNASGPLAYTPCRKDGLDRNLQNMQRVDYEALQRVRPTECVRGLTLVCTQQPDMPDSADSTD